MIINYSDQEVITGKKAIFLAGPTPREERVKSWRDEACRLLEEKGFDGVVYVPEYSTGKPLIDYDIQKDDGQVMWERIALSNSSVILFWIPRELPDMPAFTTNVEFGYWLHSGKAIYGRPDNSKKNQYLDWLYELDTNKKPINNLDELIDETIILVDKLGVTKENKVLPLEDRKIME